MNNKWMNELKHLADGAEKSPPQGLLDDIKREMSRRGVSVSPAAKRIVNVPWWQRSRVAAAVAVLLAGIATVGLMTLGDRGRAVEQQAQTRRGTGMDVAGATVAATGKPADGVIFGRGAARRGADEAHAIMAAGYDGHTDNEPGAADDGMRPMTDSIRQAVDTAPTGHADHPAVSRDHDDAPATDIPRTPGRRNERAPRGRLDTPATADRDRRPAASARRWTLAANYSGTTNPFQGDNQDMSAKSYNSFAMDMPDPYLRDALMLTAADLPPEIHEEHHAPLKMGLSVGYQLNRKWRLMTGVNYSRLRSDITEEGVGYSVTRHQTLHYIGIPLSASYSVWQTRHVNVYAKGGGEVEKLIKGRAEVQGANSVGQRSPIEKVGESRPVLSTHAAVGVEVMPVGPVSFFVEPTMTYHFSNGSRVHSIYTSQPLDFNLHLGLRLNMR